MSKDDNTNEKPNNDPTNQVWQAVHEWWEELKKDSGNRATLRRAHNAGVAALQKGYFNLYTKIIASQPPDHIQKKLDYRLPYVAGILSHVKEDDPNRTVAIAMSGGIETEKTVSDLRFRRLLRLEDYEELYPMMIRMIKMLGAKANVIDLASSVFFWNDATRRKWANRYYLRKELFASDVLNKNSNTGN